MAVQTLSIYLKEKTFYEKVRALHNDPNVDFNYTDVCAQALADEIARIEGGEASQDVVEAPGDEQQEQPFVPSVEDMAAAAAALDGFQGFGQIDYDYELIYANTAAELSAKIDHAVSSGGYPQSHSVDRGEISVIMAYPKLPPAPVE